MKNLLATALFTTLSAYSFAQKPPIKFGEVSIEDLKMTRYEKDTSAEAVVLVDFGQTEFKYEQTKGWQLYFDRTVRIKIFKKEGYRWADFSIPLYQSASDKEKITNIKGVTYTLESGKIEESKLKNEGIFEENKNDYIVARKFSLPNIKEGCVIEVSYTIVSDFLFNFQDWQFQSFIPTQWSEYRAAFPEFFHYEKYMTGYISLSINETKERLEHYTIKYEVVDSGLGRGNYRGNYMLKSNSKVHRWVANDVPAFKEEPHLSSYRDYISKINFELSHIKYENEPIKRIIGSWADLNTSFIQSDHFGSAIDGSGFLNKITEEITSGMKTPQEKIESIYNYVKLNVVWDGRYRMFLDDDFKKILEERKGSSAEINLMLVAMLQKVGINANPVIISTRDNGFIREMTPISSQFNYVICQAIVDGKSILLDATDRMLPIHILPERCLNGRGFIISKQTPGWIELSAPKSKNSASANVMLTPEGQLKGKIAISNDGYFGYSKRKEYFTKGKEEYIKDFAHQMSWEIENSEFENMENLGYAVKENYEFIYQDNFGNADVLYINPILYMRQAENPFKLETRLYPVDYGNGLDQTFICRLTVPEGFQTEELPASKVFALPNNAGKYVYSIQQTGNIINITSMFSINQPLFTQEAYPSLREFYNLVVAKQAEQIVLKRKN